MLLKSKSQTQRESLTFLSLRRTYLQSFVPFSFDFTGSFHKVSLEMQSSFPLKENGERDSAAV